LTVRHIGALVERGESSETIREDYLDMSGEDLHFARVFSRAYPKVGRPRAIVVGARDPASKVSPEAQTGEVSG
jgi:hypothetical protein